MLDEIILLSLALFGLLKYAAAVTVESRRLTIRGNDTNAWLANWFNGRLNTYSHGKCGDDLLPHRLTMLLFVAACSSTMIK
jgi:hypothetical protein